MLMFLLNFVSKPNLMAAISHLNLHWELKEDIL